MAKDDNIAKAKAALEANGEKRESSPGVNEIITRIREARERERRRRQQTNGAGESQPSVRGATPQSPVRPAPPGETEAERRRRISGGAGAPPLGTAPKGVGPDANNEDDNSAPPADRGKANPPVKTPPAPPSTTPPSTTPPSTTPPSTTPPKPPAPTTTLAPAKKPPKLGLIYDPSPRPMLKNTTKPRHPDDEEKRRSRENQRKAFEALKRNGYYDQFPEDEKRDRERYLGPEE